MKNAEVMMQSPSKSCGNKESLYGQTKEHTLKIRLKANAIFLDPKISSEKQNTITVVNEIIIEFTKSATTVIGETERAIAGVVKRNDYSAT